MKLLLTQFSPVFHHFLSTLSSITLKLCPSLRAKDQVSHPGKIVMQCILILKVPQRR